VEQTLTFLPMSAQARNESIQKTVYKERKKLLSFIRRKVSNDTDAEDILQDVFYQFVNAMQTGIIDKTAAWLFKVTNNKIIDWYRRTKPSSFNKLMMQRNSEEDSDLPLQLEDILFDPAENPDYLYLRSTVWSLLSEALEEMPEEQSEVFVLHELEGFSFKEISKTTGIPVNTLISRKRYAILYLRERLQELYNEFFTE
jgi:RNA polymerase sigma factor (sigma-70 family)